MGFRNCVKKLVNSEGINGLKNGFRVKLLHAVPYNALIFGFVDTALGLGII